MDQTTPSLLAKQGPDLLGPCPGLDHQEEDGERLVVSPAIAERSRETLLAALDRDWTKGSSLTPFNEQLAMRAEPLSWPPPPQLGAQHKGLGEELMSLRPRLLPQKQINKQRPKGQSPGLRWGKQLTSQSPPTTGLELQLNLQAALQAQADCCRASDCDHPPGA